MDSIIGKKIEQSQRFLENGKRIPVTKLGVNGNVVVRAKTLEKDRYSAVQLGFEKRTKVKSPKSTKSLYRFIREVRFADEATDLPTVGDVLKPSDIFKEGDIINATGITKGKGYAGGVKRYNFKGGPKTHGQSDRHRAPGAIGTGTTPGRVLKGKRMAGRMGHEQVTARNLEVVYVDDSSILVKGLVPGGRNNILMLRRVGAGKKFVPLFAEKIEEAKTEEVPAQEVEVKSVDGVKEPTQEEKTVELEAKEEVKTKVKEEAKEPVKEDGAK